jgi:uncharacterized membrane protein (DUF4010 family)
VAFSPPPIGFETPIMRLTLATALGLFLGLEREWSQKTAGIRTFALISLGGAVFVITGHDMLVAAGALLVVFQGLVLGVEGLLSGDEGLSLTTAVSMLVAYGVGVLVAEGFVLAGVTVAVLSSLVLVLKRELHSFAWGLSHSELRAGTEFAILAFVILPLLPGAMDVELAGSTVTIDPQVIWLMVVFVAGIGMVNYVVVQTFGGRGIAVTGFFGGVVSSTAVVGTMLDHVRQDEDAANYAIAAILLADAAMALRNLVIALVFTVGVTAPLFEAVLPLGTVVLAAALIAAVTADWRATVDIDLESPFSLRNALTFGGLFLFVVVAGGLAEAFFGATGLFVAALLTGLVSSAGATTSAVVLYRGGAIDPWTATVAILLATASSIAVKAGLTALGPERRFAARVGAYSGLLLLAAGLVTAVGAL